jgi:hypothetical protein
MRWSLFSLIASAVLALTLAATVSNGPPAQPRLVPLTSAPNCSAFYGCSSGFCRRGIQITYCTGSPGGAVTKRSPKPATSNDTAISLMYSAMAAT